MNSDPRHHDLLDDLAADAPLRRMRARLDGLISEPPRARPSPAIRRLLAAAAAVAVIATALVLVQHAAPPEARSGSPSVVEMLEAPSTFERLRAVNTAASLLTTEPRLREGLLRRLETDSSLNVRLAALQVLLSEAPDDRQIDRLLTGLAGQETPIVQAHIGHQLRRRGLLTEAELSRLAAQPGFHEQARDALVKAEDL